MEKIELEIVALSHSIAGSQSYAVVLGESKGVRRLPIVIGGPEAQAIAVALEKMNPSRPLTHDLMKNIFGTFNISLEEIVINNLKDGIFFAQLICKHGDERVEIDSRTSDALALAVRFGCPIFTYEFVLDQAGIVMEEGQQKQEDEDEDDEVDETMSEEGDDDIETEVERMVESVDLSNLSGLSMDELRVLLDDLLSKEAYEEAAKVRDEIQRREQSS